MSSAANTSNSDFLGETGDGSQMPMLNVFRRDGQAIRHFWGAELLYASPEPGRDPWHSNTIDPVSCPTSRPRDAEPTGTRS